MSLKRWQDRSFFIELKPRTEFASLFVDCPPPQPGRAVSDDGDGNNDTGDTVTTTAAGDTVTTAAAGDTVTTTAAPGVTVTTTAAPGVTVTTAAAGDTVKTTAAATATVAVSGFGIAGAEVNTQKEKETAGDEDAPPPPPPPPPLLDEPSTSSSRKEVAERKELVNIREHSLELHTLPENAESDDASATAECQQSTIYSIKFGDLTLQPNSICALTWADNRQLFMCKIRAIVGGCPLVPKTFHRLATDVLSGMLLDEYIENAQSYPIRAECSECSVVLLDYPKDSLIIHPLPEDGWLNTSPSMEYFCRDTCGTSHSSHAHHVAHSSDLVSAAEARKRWLPNDERIVVSDSFILVLRKMVAKNTITVDEASGVVRCEKCLKELGTVLRGNPEIVQLHHVLCNLMVTGGREIYINTRFGSLERFFAWMLLYHCESQTSQKLVFRSLDKRPFVLVWLLDSYVVISQGALQTAADAEQNNGIVYSFPALKMLYKIFDSDLAQTDPRANGEDASVGLVDVPMICCVKLTEMLIKSSLALPPAGRRVGQFYIGFLKLKNMTD